MEWEYNTTTLKQSIVSTQNGIYRNPSLAAVSLFKGFRPPCDVICTKPLINLYQSVMKKPTLAGLTDFVSARMALQETASCVDWTR